MFKNSLTLSSRAATLALATSIFIGGAGQALAGDAEITLKFATATVATADTLTGHIDLGGLALVGLEPDEIDVSVFGSSTGSAGGAGKVSMGDIHLAGVYPEDLDLPSSGLTLTTDPTTIVAPGFMVEGTGYDSYGRLSTMIVPASLVLETDGAMLHEAVVSERPYETAVVMDLSLTLLYIDHDGGAGFEPQRLFLGKGASLPKGSVALTNLPDAIQTDPGVAEASAGCVTAAHICACGDADGCNLLIAGCFATAGAPGEWNCMQYNDEGQCVLGTCNW